MQCTAVFFFLQICAILLLNATFFRSFLIFSYVNLCGQGDIGGCVHCFFVLKTMILSHLISSSLFHHLVQKKYLNNSKIGTQS